jgi:effector-binding domain-containing protein
MKKTLLISSGCLLFLLVGFFAFAPVHFKVDKEITIPSPIFDVSPQFTDLRNWRNWFPDLKNKDLSAITYSPVSNSPGSFLSIGTDLYTITSGNPASVTFKEQRGGRISYCLIASLPDSIASRTRVKWVKWLSPIDWLKEKLGISDELQTGLNNLRYFEVDTKQFYGFAIAIEPVVDTLVLTKKAVVKKSEIAPSLEKLFAELLDYARANNMPLSGEGARMASFYDEGKDSIHLAAGIPVRRRGPAKNGMLFLEMPAKGRMLVGQYQGPYAGLNQLYSAMQKYMSDKGLLRIGAVYEKYLSLPKSSEDSLHMKIELHFPVI